MYKIVDTIVSDFDSSSTKEFSLLLDTRENETNIWAAIHLLEKMKTNPATEEKALMIIKNAMERNYIRGLGCWLWLGEWKNKVESNNSA